MFCINILKIYGKALRPVTEIINILQKKKTEIINIHLPHPSTKFPTPRSAWANATWVLRLCEKIRWSQVLLSGREIIVIRKCDFYQFIPENHVQTITFWIFSNISGPFTSPSAYNMQNSRYSRGISECPNGIFRSKVWWYYFETKNHQYL